MAAGDLSNMGRQLDGCLGRTELLARIFALVVPVALCASISNWFVALFASDVLVSAITLDLVPHRPVRQFACFISLKPARNSFTIAESNLSLCYRWSGSRNIVTKWHAQ